ncbi:MAG: MBL fold metallo-hydrolase [Acidobacteria bacterium]|nr:MBL fold metallo-hydrolase [Acidobacteriota bacterium]
MSLKFWGVRGGTPTPDVSKLAYGGHTPCVEVRLGGQLKLILDAGSGLRSLGAAMEAERGDSPAEAHLFLSHFHWDHIQGLPFFAPLYSPDWRLTIHSGRPVPEVQAALATQMSHPYFPAAATVRAQLEHRQAGRTGAKIDDLSVLAFALNHPGGSTGYRIDSPYGSIVFATDHEHGDPAGDSRLRLHVQDADILIYDSQYTPAEYEFKKGWGHSTWLEGARLAASAGVKQLILFHHDPERDDDGVSRLEEAAMSVFPNTIAAREGVLTVI